MELRAVVKYQGDWAHYTITPDASGVYHARLIKYEGGNVFMPPKEVILLKGANRWVGSAEESYFLQDLGNAIDKRVRGSDPHNV